MNTIAGISTPAAPPPSPPPKPVWEQLQELAKTASPWFTAASFVYSVYDGNRQAEWQSKVDDSLKEINRKLDIISAQLEAVLKAIEALPAKFKEVEYSLMRQNIISYNKTIEIIQATPAAQAPTALITQVNAHIASLRDLASKFKEGKEWMEWLPQFTASGYKNILFHYLFDAAKDRAEKEKLKTAASNELKSVIKWFTDWLDLPDITYGTMKPLAELTAEMKMCRERTMPYVGREVGFYWRSNGVKACAGHFILQGNITAEFFSASPGQWEESGWFPEAEIFSSFASMPDTPMLKSPPAGAGWNEYHAVIDSANRRVRQYLEAERGAKELTQTRADMTVARQSLTVIQQDIVNWK